MAAKGAKPKKSGGKRSRASGSTKGGAAKGAPVLGNDPFERGAAVRTVANLAPVTSTVVEPPPARSEVVDPSAARESLAASAAVEHPAPSDAGSVPVPSPVDESAVPSPVAGVPVESPAAASPVAAQVDAVRARLGTVEARVEAVAASAIARLGDLARQEASGEQARDLLRTIRALLPGVRDRLSALAGLASLFLSSGELDAWGLDRDLATGVAPMLDFLYARWWRVDARDVERIPSTGPAILVANHGGVLPWDALVLRTALRRDHPAHRDLRPLLDEHALTRRLSGSLARRLGAVSATPENASQLLDHGAVIAVFPEGSRGSTRPWADRYRIQRFGRGGFARLALRSGAPIVPCAIVGSEETALPMARAGWLSSALGMPFLTSPPPPPFVPLGAVPLPARWSLRFGSPIETASAGPDAAADTSRVLELTERVRAALQQMLDEDVAARRSVYL